MRDNSLKFHLWLDKLPYHDEIAVYNVLKQQSNIAWDFELFEQILHRQDTSHSPLYKWDYCPNNQKVVIEKAFADIGIQLRIEEIVSPFLFPTEQLSNFRNNWFSRELDLLSEDALDDWAIANHYNEVYRVTLFPSFEGTLTVRVCSESITFKEAQFWKTLHGEKFHYESWVPNRNTWFYIQNTINQNDFWEDVTWDTVPEGYSVLDGCTYMVEGYKDGLYKFLYDEGAVEDKAGYVAGEFTKLRPDKP